MKFFARHSRVFRVLLDLIIISVATIIANILLCQEGEVFSNENQQIIIKSVICSLIIYELYLNIFKVYRHITRFENGKDYFIYIMICLFASITLALISLIPFVNINNILFISVLILR